MRCALVFSGGFCDTAALLPMLPEAELVICADSGLETARRCGIEPDWIVGDFDSSPCPTDTEAEILRVPAEKNETDTMLACRTAIERGARSIWILGGTGGRIDHSLSNFFLLEALQREGISAVLTDGQNRIRVLADATLTLPRSHFRYFSVFSLGESVITLAGCRYPLDGHLLCRAHAFAVSNEIVGEAATVTVSGAPVFVVESEVTPSP